MASDDNYIIKPKAQPLPDREATMNSWLEPFDDDAKKAGNFKDDSVSMSFQPTGKTAGRGVLTVTYGKKNFTDTLNLTKATDRTKYAEAAATATGADVSDIQMAIDVELQRALSPVMKSDDLTPLETSEQELKATSKADIAEATEFLKRPDLLKQTGDHIQFLGLAGERELAAQIFLIGTSRLLDKPLSSIILAASSSGKSYSQDLVASLFPDEAVLKSHRFSTASLQYMKNRLQHRFVLGGERSHTTTPEQADATHLWRQLVSDGYIRATITTKDSTGNFAATEFNVRGPVAWTETSTIGIDDIFPEDRNRMLILSTNESETQTELVKKMMASAAAGCGLKPDERKAILQLHHTAQRLLKPCSVVIPYAQRLCSAIPDTRPEARRTFGHLLSAIRACACLHQFQRSMTDAGDVIATIADYNLVRHIFREPLGRSVGAELTGGAKLLMQKIKAKFDTSDTFTPAEVSEATGESKSPVYAKLKELVASGELHIEIYGEGRTANRYKISAMHISQNFILPELAGNEDAKC